MSDSPEVTAAIAAAEGLDLGPDTDEPAAPEAEAVEVEGDEVETAETDPAPPPDAEEAEPPPDKRSKVMASLMRKEGQLREAQTAFDQKVEAFGQQIEDVKAQGARFTELQKMATTDPAAFLAEAGVDIEVLSKQLISGETPKKADPELATLRKELDEIKESRKARDAQQEKYQEQARHQGVQRHIAELGNFVAASSAEYPMVAALDAKESTERLLSITRQHWDATKVILDKSAAAGKLESVLLDQYQRLHGAASKQAGAGKAATAPPASGKPPRTLGKNHGSRTTKTPSNMSNAERIAAAIEMMEEADPFNHDA